MDTLPERVVALEGAHNVRDLGGYPLTTGGETRWRAVLRGDNLSALTDADATALLALGVRTVVDLRGDAELAAQPNPFADGGKLRYLNIPLYDEMAPILAADANFDMGARYVAALERCGPRIAEVLAAIADAAPGAVLFHCTAGKDRTGIIAALLLTLCAVPRETVVADYVLTGRAGALLEKLRRAALARGAAPEHVDLVLASAAETIEAMLSYLDSQKGGIGTYLDRIGVDLPTRQRLTQRLAG